MFIDLQNSHNEQKRMIPMKFSTIFEMLRGVTLLIGDDLFVLLFCYCSFVGRGAVYLIRMSIGKNMSGNLIIGISHKAYFGYQQTQQWCEAVAATLRQPALCNASIELFTFPAMPTICTALRAFADTRMAIGSQNVCEAPAGAWTGETSASLLQEMGCRYVEIGHAERRCHFGETVEVINRKIDMAFACELTPVICIGEAELMNADAAAAFALDQAQELLAHRIQPLPPLIFAWEPQWAIGAAQPASDDYIRHVCRTLREALHQRYGQQCRVIYGGSAGPGLLTRLWPDADGIFLGRFSHQPQAVATILDEALALIASV